MLLTEKEIINNYERIIKIINDTFSGIRKENLLKLYQSNTFRDRLLFAPASGRDYYHGCYPGGYMVHILNVVNGVILLDKLWINMGATKNYTDEEMIFSALNHDLGKLGSDDEPYYIQQSNNWRRERGELYEHNPKLDNMAVEDRSLFLLQKYGVEISLNEFLAIKLHDGLYEEGNKRYYIVWTDDKKLKSNLPVLLHHADMTATLIEYNQWKSKSLNKTSRIKKQHIKNTKSNKIDMSKLSGIDKLKLEFFKESGNK